jgi:hypothetical protein
VTRYRDNPRRLHDDFADACREIARAVGDDVELDEGPIRALRDVCGLSAIDIRLAVPEVGEMEAARRRQTARLPSARAQGAAARLLAEIGEALEPELRAEMAEDAETVASARAQDGDLLPEGRARDAMLRLASRFGWLHRFGYQNADRIGALAARVGRSYAEVERIVNLISGAREWHAVIEVLMRVV